MIIKDPDMHNDAWKRLEEIVAEILGMIRNHELGSKDKSNVSVDLGVLDTEEERWKKYTDYFPKLEDRSFEDGYDLLKEIARSLEAKDLSSLGGFFEELSNLAEGSKWGIEYHLEEIEELLPVLEIGEGEILYSVKEPLLYTPSVLISISTDLLKRLAENPQLLFQISPRQFEEVVGEIFTRNGFNVKLTKRTRDGGKDIIAFYNKLNIETKFIIECKRWVHKKVSLGVVQRLLGVKLSEGAHKAILATTSTFTKDAIDFKLSNGLWDLELKDYDDITEWLRSFS